MLLQINAFEILLVDISYSLFHINYLISFVFCTLNRPILSTMIDVYRACNELKYYDYLTTQTPENLSDNNLYEKWLSGATVPRGSPAPWLPPGMGPSEIAFMFIL